MFVSIDVLSIAVWVVCWTSLWTNTFVVPKLSCLSNYYYIFAENMILPTSFLKKKEKLFTFSKTKSQDLFSWKGFPKLTISKTIGFYKLVWSHYLEKLSFLKLLPNRFQTSSKKFKKRDMLMSLLFSRKCCQDLLLYLKPSLNPTLTWSSLSTY
jgi:hypothetical protein